jgi:hypothetical protein
MTLHQNYSAEEKKEARLPHELFLFNMIGNHILLNVIVLSNVNVMPELGLIVPIIAVFIIAYILLKGPSKLKSESLLVRYHWHLVLKRTKIFLIGYGVLLVASLMGWLIMLSNENVMPELIYAIIGGLGILPVMALVLILTVMDSESLYEVINGKTPKKVPPHLLGGNAEVVTAEQSE